MVKFQNVEGDIPAWKIAAVLFGTSILGILIAVGIILFFEI